MIVNNDTVIDANRALAWFAVQTRSRHEKLVRNQLTQHNIEPFLPSFTRVSQWKDRKKKIEFPLFPGYCFARFIPRQHRYTVLQCPGVVRIVGSPEMPEIVPDVEIESLRLVLEQSYPHCEHPFLREGMAVEVIRGPLKGARGHLVRHARNCRLVLSVTLIQRAVAVEINDSDIAPA
ncbi:transcription termination factor NusG domain protein [Nitrospira sp.]|nr:transcription termination factor NusG domain protein [Nitrospira sp.]